MRKEIVINKSRIPTLLVLIVSVSFFCFAVHDLLGNNVIRGVTFLVLTTLFLILFKSLSKRNQALIKISEEHLWTRNRGNKSWDYILVIKFRSESNQWFMDVYMSNDIVADEEISLHQINMPVWWLKRLLKKYAKVEYH